MKENEGKRFAYFAVPKGKLEDLRLAISNNQLKQTSRLCDTVFLEDDLNKGKVIEGKCLNSKLWRLQKDAIPKLFLSNSNVFVLHLLFSDICLRCKPTAKHSSIRNPLKALNIPNKPVAHRKTTQIVTVQKNL